MARKPQTQVINITKGNPIHGDMPQRLEAMGVPPHGYAIEREIEKIEGNLKHALRNQRMVRKYTVSERKEIGAANVRLATAKLAIEVRQLKARLQTLKRALKQASNPARPTRVRLVTLRQGKAEASIYRHGPRFLTEIRQGMKLLDTQESRTLDAARSYARLKLFDVASNPKGVGTDDILDIIPGGGLVRIAGKLGDTKIGGKKRKGKRNPESIAAKVYEDFHGHAPKEILEITEQEHYHSVTVGLGRLVSMNITDVQGKQFALNAPGFSMGRDGNWNFDSATPLTSVIMLTSSEDGKQLFIQGGDQSIDLKAIGMDSEKRDNMLIGTITQITYRTRKSFDDNRVIDYYHELGKEGSKGIMPVLIYHPRSKKMEVSGGRYYIAPPDRRIGNVSPGIVG